MRCRDQRCRVKRTNASCARRSPRRVLPLRSRGADRRGCGARGHLSPEPTIGASWTKTLGARRVPRHDAGGAHAWKVAPEWLHRLRHARALSHVLGPHGQRAHRPVCIRVADPQGRRARNALRRACRPSPNHAFPVASGILEDECAAELRSFFRRLRGARREEGPRAPMTFAPGGPGGRFRRRLRETPHADSDESFRGRMPSAHALPSPGGRCAQG